MNYFTLAFNKFTDFRTRSNRREYWYFVLIQFIIALVLSAICYLIKNNILSYIFSIVMFVPGLTVAVRRLHDINKSGWWYLVIFIPIAGIIWLIVLLAKEGDKGPNNYGEESFA